MTAHVPVAPDRVATNTAGQAEPMRPGAPMTINEAAHANVGDPGTWANEDAPPRPGRLLPPEDVPDPTNGRAAAGQGKGFFQHLCGG